MRHRIVSGTGLGNPDPVLLNNEGEINEFFAEAALKEYFYQQEGFDFQIEEDMVNIGIEPTYQGDELLLPVCLCTQSSWRIYEAFYLPLPFLLNLVYSYSPSRCKMARF